jgi:predicted AlkP superfamily pyrophosphatase or phosphodiesterase
MRILDRAQLGHCFSRFAFRRSSAVRAWLAAAVGLLSLMAFCGPVSAGEGASPPAPTVILISLDGTRPVDVQKEVLPSLFGLAAQGAVAERLIPAIPTNTFPNHVTLVTGVAPERHGLVNNVFVDAEKGVFDKQDIPAWIEVEPLWSILAGEGIDSASYYWVGSEGPWRGDRGATHWMPFSSKTDEMTKVVQILAWLDLPEAQRRPHFITSWFHGADRAGHYHGPGSGPVRAALRSQDAAIAALVLGLEARGLFASTTLIFVSDHGMASPDRRVDLGGALERAGVEAHVFGIGGFASIHPSRRDDPAAVTRAIEVARGLGLEAFARESAPAGARVANARFGPVIVRAPAGTAIVHAGLELVGFHGYDPEMPSMSALFMARGRGVRPGSKLPAVRSSDVAPTVLALLGVEPPHWMEGSPISSIVPRAPDVYDPPSMSVAPPRDRRIP